MYTMPINLFKVTKYNVPIMLQGFQYNSEGLLLVPDFSQLKPLKPLMANSGRVMAPAIYKQIHENSLSYPLNGTSFSLAQNVIFLCFMNSCPSKMLFS